MPLQATSGAASYDAFGGGVPFEPIYIEQVFQNWLYTGNGSTQTITNGIDLAGKGGMVWTKARSAANRHALVDTVRGGAWELASNLTDGQNAISPATTFGAAGYTMNDSATSFNSNGVTYASWTFREQPKFFDVVTYTGNGVAGTTIAHNLGSVPGCIMVKSLGAPVNGGADGFWFTYHQGLTTPQSGAVFLNNTDGRNGTGAWNNTLPTSTVFTVDDGSYTNINGRQYVAYLFAHNAGGFGLTGTDNVISCGSFTTTGSTVDVNLGYEPQWVMFKAATRTDNWRMVDNMRGWTADGTDTASLLANTSNAETSATLSFRPTATGFTTIPITAGTTYIYIAIRRGPMKVPTDGTKVFAPIARTGTGATAVVTTPNFVVDSAWIQQRTSGWQAAKIFDRLRGATNLVYSNTTSAEVSDATTLTSFASNVGFTLGDDSNNYSVNRSGEPYINWAFKRAPSFFDEVCFTGVSTGNQTLNHNLQVVPELIITKCRSDAINWYTYSATTGVNKYLVLNSTAAAATSTGIWPSTPTSTTFDINVDNIGLASRTAVAYLFATCPGVSKVFNFTGNGSSQTINCGFTGGARFVMIKRTDSTGDWYVWDTARGIVVNNDPHLSLNTAAAEVTTNDTIDTDSTGFVVNQVSATNVNVNGASYIGLAIA